MSEQIPQQPNIPTSSEKDKKVDLSYFKENLREN